MLRLNVGTIEKRQSMPASFPAELVKWTAGYSNTDFLVASQASSYWTNSPFIFIKRSVRELNPILVLTTDVCCQNTYRPSR